MSKDVITPHAVGLLSDDEQTGSFRARYVRYFFVGMACLFPVIIVLGFTPSFMSIQSGQYQPHWFVHVHGSIMASWLIVFLTQSILAARGNFRFHRSLGLFSVGLGIIVCLAMITASIRVRIAYAPPVEDGVWDILLLELSLMLLFTTFFVWGVLVRKNAASHKRLLFLATMVLIQAGIDRIQWLPALHSAVFVRFIYFDALLIPLFIYDLFTVGKIHRVTWITCTLIMAMQITVTFTWGSPALHQFWYKRFDRFVEHPVEVKLTEEQKALLIGSYGDQNWSMVISQQGDTLFLKLPDFDKLELRATSATELFVKTAMWKLSFVKGDDGKVTKLINRQAAFVWETRRYK